MTSVNAFPNPSYLSGMRPFQTFDVAGLSQPSLPSGSCSILSPSFQASPATISGVTGMQANSANEMSGGLLEPTGDLAGGVSDGAAAARRGASATVFSAADGVRGFARGAGRLLGPVSVGLDLVGGGMKINEAWNDRTLTDRQRDEKVGEAAIGTAGSVAGGTGGAIAGAAAGAALGSVFPVVGTVIGGVAGAIIGGFLGGKAGEAVGRTSVGRRVGDTINDLGGR